MTAVRTLVGVDFAAQEKGTCAAYAEWDGSAALRIVGTEKGVDDNKLVKMATQGHAVVALDVPFGWPDNFVSFVAEYREKKTVPKVDRSEFMYRVTDRFVLEKTGKRPLSVSSDRISLAARRLAAIIKSFRGSDVVPFDDRGSATKVIEVYPAATLAALKLPYEMYKSKEKPQQAVEVRQQIISRLLDSRLEMAPGIADECLSNHDALDACVCALTAKLHLDGRTWPAPDDPVVKREGWIFFPKLDE